MGAYKLMASRPTPDPVPVSLAPEPLLPRALLNKLFDSAVLEDPELVRSIAVVFSRLANTQIERARSSPVEQSEIRITQDGGDVATLVRQMLVARQEDGLSRRYVETLRSHLNRFAAACPARIATIHVGDMEKWLRSQPVGPRARNNMRASIVTLFRFAQKQGYLPKGARTEADEIAKAKDRGGEIGVLTPMALARLLHEPAPERIHLFLALGAFTGMRSSEILRLQWADVNFDRRFITVAAHKTKTATRRLVPVLPNLLEWIIRYRQAEGCLFDSRRDASSAIAFAKACGVPWPNNALRHSYATYRLALTADAARVALEMGNSPQKLMRNYRELADQNEAAAWFSITPDLA